MGDSPGKAAISAAIERLQAHGVVPEAGDVLALDSERFASDLQTIIYGSVPAYSDTGNPDVVPELDRHIDDHLAELCRLLGSDGGDRQPGDFAFVAEHARRRALQKFPLDATHQVYRHLGKELLSWIRDAALNTADKNAQVPRVVADVTEFVFEYMGTAGTTLTSNYVEETRLISEGEGDRRTRLLSTLLDGYDETDPVAATLLRRSGYLEQRQSYCVAVARSVNPQEMDNPARAQRMADAVAEALAGAPLRTLVGVRDNLVYVVVSGTRRLSGWTAPQSLLADRIYPQLRKVGPAALIGMSNDAPSTSHIPRAANEARMALDFADVASRVMRYSAIPFRQMLVSRAKDEIQSALPAWLDSFQTADRKARGSLAATLRAYADADMNVLKSAKLLGIHPNTVYARMQKIEDLTGQNALNYHALTEMLLALESV